MAAEKDFDVIVYGASGFTGRLVAEYLGRTYPEGAAWAMAGRNADKLAAVRDEMDLPAHTPLVVADADDPASLAAMAQRARVVLTTVGPYTLYGEPLVKACVEAGAGYVDLCGEPLWMRKMIDAYGAPARESGARIVFSCGFDSIPFDLGVYYLQERAKETLGAPVPRVRGRVRAMKGTFSGGTAASFRETIATLTKDPGLMGVIRSPFALTPEFDGPTQPDDTAPYEDAAVGSWVTPFIMASINTKNVHRSNFLMGHPYGQDFAYDEMMMTGPGAEGEKAAKALASVNPLAGDDAPKPGEGPDKEERETGFYDVLFLGESPDGQTVKASVKGDKDPGYGSTSKMIAESALCLAADVSDLGGGFYTPAAAFGSALIDRLQAKAGLTFAPEN
ncbi:MAG: saccharopine dehydrogenase NADP-binding domain-containing protein [Pseudomonadota bacterium]